MVVLPLDYKWRYAESLGGGGMIQLGLDIINSGVVDNILTPILKQTLIIGYNIMILSALLHALL